MRCNAKFTRCHYARCYLALQHDGWGYAMTVVGDGHLLNRLHHCPISGSLSHDSSYASSAKRGGGGDGAGGVGGGGGGFPIGPKGQTSRFLRHTFPTCLKSYVCSANLLWMIEAPAAHALSVVCP